MLFIEARFDPKLSKEIYIQGLKIIGGEKEILNLSISNSATKISMQNHCCLLMHTKDALENNAENTGFN